jgi:hypothetical protein
VRVADLLALVELVDGVACSGDDGGAVKEIMP